MEISIGKFTLESLTTGMYNEPETCYREYIQNAVDAIDNAVERGIISVSESRIEIIVALKLCLLMEMILKYNPRLLTGTSWIMG